MFAPIEVLMDQHRFLAVRPLLPLLSCHQLLNLLGNLPILGLSQDWGALLGLGLQGLKVAFDIRVDAARLAINLTCRWSHQP